VASVKLIVVGPGEAGKSTLIGLLTGDAMNLAVRGRTVAMDHGMLRRNGQSLSLVGVPGQERFAPVREALLRGAAAAIWVHPAGQPADPWTVALLASVEGGALPYLVFVNRRGEQKATDGFVTPRELQEPRAVLYGSLAAAPKGLTPVLEAVWMLATAGPKGPREEQFP
jgi:hypothetical protein